jgi:hypothetical protein
MENDRNQIIDFFRGIAIGDMIFVHFTGYFPVFAGKILSYTDMAIEGFVLLSGFMIGQHYYPRYVEDRKEVTGRLFNRTFQILLIQYLLIFTINLPLYYVLYDKIRETESVSVFLVKSMLFLNQIGLMHILPTFIPLFLISPAILYLINKKLTPLLVVCSISLFVLGNKYPYALDLSDKTIFPFILWQIYFVAGCFLGKEAYLKGKICPKNIKAYFWISMFALFIAVFIKHAKVIPPSFTSKFPLNALGLLYGGSFLFVIYTVTLKYWDRLLGKTRIFNYYIPLLGRHSLLAFVVHVYTARILLLLNQSYGLSSYLNYLLIVASVVGIYIVIFVYDGKEKKKFQYLAVEKIL